MMRWGSTALVRTPNFGLIFSGAWVASLCRTGTRHSQKFRSLLARFIPSRGRALRKKLWPRFMRTNRRCRAWPKKRREASVKCTTRTEEPADISQFTRLPTSIIPAFGVINSQNWFKEIPPQRKGHSIPGRPQLKRFGRLSMELKQPEWRGRHKLLWPERRRLFTIRPTKTISDCRFQTADLGLSIYNLKSTI